MMVALSEFQVVLHAWALIVSASQDSEKWTGNLYDPLLVKLLYLSDIKPKVAAQYCLRMLT